MNTIRLTFLLLLLIGVSAVAQPKEEFRIKYLSSENAYLSGGRQDGLAVGDRLTVSGEGTILAVLEVIFVADYSASCRILSGADQLTAGLLAVVSERSLRPETPVVDPPENRQEPPDVETREPELAQPTAAVQRKVDKRKQMRISGTISGQWYQLDDLSTANRDFSQPSFRISFRARQLWNKPYQLRIRTRSRYDSRTQPVSRAVASEVWRHRIYQFAFSFHDPDARINYQFGRILSPYMSGVGYVDGVQTQVNINQELALGLLGGVQPDFRRSDLQSSISKFGAYLHYGSRDIRPGISGTIAAAGEYNGSTVSREFIYLQSRYSHKGLSIYQSAEIDVNRGWRKERSGQSLELSNLRLSGRMRLSSALSASLSYDNRRRYWTYEVRTLADSLFDDALRQGFRGTMSLRLPAKVRVSGGAGYRGGAADRNGTFSYHGSLSQAGLFGSGLSLSLRAAGFDGDLTDGLTTSASLARSIGGVHRVEVAYGSYRYRFSADNLERNSWWIRPSGYLSLTRHFFLQGQLEIANGDDLDNRRIFLEIGYRL